MPWSDRYKLQSPIKVLKKDSKKKQSSTSVRGKGKDSKSKPAGKSAAEVWVCEECQEGFTEDTDKVVSCSRCGRYFCTECIELPDEQYEIITRPDIFWLCPECVPKTKACWDGDLLVDTRCDTIMQEMEKKFEALEVKLGDKLDNQLRSLTEGLPQQISTIENNMGTQLKTLSEEMQQNVTKAWSSPPQAQDSQKPPPNLKLIMKETLDEQKKEAADRENRENNIIIYNVDESEKDTAEERKESDSCFFSNLCEEILLIPVPTARNLMRLGKKPAADEPQKPRPLKVVLESKDDKDKVMENLTKLKNAEEKFRKISVTPDYCMEDREKIRVKVAEAKKLNEEDQSKNFTYRVRGPPWNLRIVKFQNKV